MNSGTNEVSSDLTSTSNTERQSALDAIPTSSTDANTVVVKTESGNKFLDIVFQAEVLFRYSSNI